MYMYIKAIIVAVIVVVIIVAVAVTVCLRRLVTADRRQYSTAQINGWCH